MKRISDEEIGNIYVGKQTQHHKPQIKDLWPGDCKLFEVIAQAQLEADQREIDELQTKLMTFGMNYKKKLEAREKEHKEKIDQAIDAATTAYESTCEALIQEKVKEIFELVEALTPHIFNFFKYRALKQKYLNRED